jgi:hypothetical protein
MITLQELEQLKEEKLNSLQEGIGSAVKKGAKAVAPAVGIYAGVIGIDRMIRGLIRETNKQFRECRDKALDNYNKKMVRMKGFPYYKLKHLEAQYNTELAKCKHAYEDRILKIKEKRSALKAEMTQRKKRIK